MKYGYVAATILLTVYGQMVVKWQVSKSGGLHEAMSARVTFLLRMLVNPWILSGLVAALVAALSWMAAMTKFDLSYAYPFMSVSFILVLVFSALFFKEPLTAYKIVGMALIALGLFVSSRSS